MSSTMPPSIKEFEIVNKIVGYFNNNVPNVITSTDWTLRRSAERFASFTKFGNVAVHSSVKNRSAKISVYIGSDAVRLKTHNPQQAEIINNLPKTLALVEEYVKKAPFVRINRSMGDNPEFSPTCNFYVSIQRPEMIRLAYMTWATLFPVKPGGGPNQYIVYIPEWQESDRQILIFP
ncbi:MAG: hypothetical protein AAB318_00745, partial [Planctomycetota bacterium]